MGKLILIYGINAVGKDALAEKLANNFYHQSFITSEQRILMYHLGIANEYQTTKKITRDQYKSLENTPLKTIEKIYQFKFLETLINLKKKYEFVFLTCHLVVSLHLDKKQIYLDCDKANKKLSALWLDIADGIIYLKSDPLDILKRRLKDVSSKQRERVLKLNSIAYHQKMCDKKWHELLVNVPQNKTITIHNDNGGLNKSISKAKMFIDKL